MNKIKSGIYPKHLMEFIIKPTLDYMEMGGNSAYQLMIGTAAIESRLGRYLKQIKGPALGMYQMEPSTHRDIYLHHLKYPDNFEQLEKINDLSRHVMIHNRENELYTNLEYGTALARLKYWRVKERLPEYGDIDGMAVYWKNYYNTSHGDGIVEEFIRVYHKYIEGQLSIVGMNL